jgi:hypothetical protein
MVATIHTFHDIASVYYDVIVTVTMKREIHATPS